MARWTLKCENCGFPFTHSQTDDSSAPNFFLPEKPDFPAGGSEFECPNCGHESTYQRTDLVYQA
jgi:rubredoxin